MAKGTTIGLLNFGIDGDDKGLRKKLEAIKKDAVYLEEIFKNIKLNTGGNAVSTDVQKAQKASDGLAISNNKVARSAAILELAETKAANEVVKGTQRQIYEKERLIGLQKRNALIGVQGQKQISSAFGLTNKTMFDQKNLLQQLSSAMGIYFSIYQAGAFVKELAMVSGEFEKQRLSLRAILQDTAAADKIFGQIKDLAVYSPFNFKELTDYAKQLSAFSIPTNEIFDTMNRLADISAGLGVDMNRIILAYGQVRSASVLRGQELRQFTEAGIPLVDELAKKFGELSGQVVTAGEVFDKISNREVPFQMIKDIFIEMTSEGGKFYKMQEIQATSLAGKISNLRDAYDIMLDSIGAANSGFMKGVVDGLVGIMDNWEKYWRILRSIIATYGTYRAILIAVSAIERTMASIQTIQRFISLSRAITGASTATIGFAAATRSLSAAIASNPLGLAAVAVATLVGSMIYLYEATSTQAEAQRNLNKILKESEDIKQELNDQTNQLVGVINSETKTIYDRITAYKQLQKIYNGLLKDMTLQEFQSKSATEQQKLLNKAMNDLEISDSNKKLQEFISLQERLNSVQKGWRGVDEYNKLIKEIGVLLDLEGASSLFIKETFEQTLELLKDRHEEIENIRKEEEFESKSNEEKLILLNKQLEKLKEQESDIRSQLISVRNLNGEWDKLNPTFTGLNKILSNILLNTTNVESRIKSLLGNNERTDNELKTENDINDRISSLKKERSDLDLTSKAYAEYTKRIEILESRLPKSKKGGSAKDPFVEGLKEQIDLIKQAKVEYEKLLKVMSVEQANTKFSELRAFSGISVADISTGYDDYIENIIKQLEEKGNKISKEGKTLLRSLILGQSQSTTEQITKDAKSEIDKIEKELSKYKDQYSLYEYIFGKTGDKGQASQIAFGDVSKTVKSYREALSAAIDETDNSELKKKLEEQLIDLDFNESSSLSKRMADLISQYQSTEEKITSIQKKYADEREKILNSDNDQNFKDSYIEALSKAEEEEIGKLKEELFTLTDYYQNIFGDLSEITFKGLKKMASKGRSIINSAKEKRDPKNDNKVLGYTLFDGKKQFEIPIQQFERFRKKIVEFEKTVNEQDPFGALAKNITRLQSGNIKLSTFAKAASENLSDIMDIANEVGESLSTMLSSLGDEVGTEAIEYTLELGNALSNLASDLSSGNPVQQVTGIIKGITGLISSIANYHDKKLEKAIKRSQIEVKKLQNAYENLSRFVSRQLGAITTKQAQQQIDNLKAQQEELKKQQKSEEKKKKKDKAAIEDYKATISELGDQIAYFYEDLFNELYNFDFKSIADQISSALVDAFKSGEDAALAFDNTVADIINKLATDMISLQVIQPAMEKLRDYLFGSNGVFMDGELSVTDAQGLVAQLAALRGSIGDAKTIWDALNEAANQAGIDLGDMTNSTKDTLSKGIQSVTEDTANLLASYLNAMRADLAAQKQFIQQLVMFAQSHTDQFALMYAELLRIQVNTLATANNTAIIAETTTATYNLLRQATIPGSGTSINLT